MKTTNMKTTNNKTQQPENASTRFEGCPTCDLAVANAASDDPVKQTDGVWTPSHCGSSMCRMGSSLAAGGTEAHCTCNACF